MNYGWYNSYKYGKFQNVNSFCPQPFIQNHYAVLDLWFKPSPPPKKKILCPSLGFYGINYTKASYNSILPTSSYRI